VNWPPNFAALKARGYWPRSPNCARCGAVEPQNIFHGMTDALDALPPFSADIESATLACIPDHEKAGERLDALTAQDFYESRHAIIYQALRQLRRDGKGLTLVALHERVKGTGLDGEALESLLRYVRELPDRTPSPEHWPQWLEELKGYAVRRAALRDAAQLEELARDLTVTPTALQDAVQRLGRAHYANGSLPAIIDACEFLGTPLPANTELVSGVLHLGSKLVLGGGSKTFKTWLLLDLGLAVAAAEPWLGFKTTKGKVLFANFEIQPAFFQRRIEAVIQAKGIKLEAGQLDVWNLRGYAQGYRVLVPRIIERVGKGYRLVILDPIYKLYAGLDENKAGDVAGLLNSLELLTAETGAAVAFGAHYAKGNAANKEVVDRISGSGVFARDPDSIVNFTRHETEDAFTVEFTLRNFRPVEPFAVRWQYPLMRRDDNLDPAKLKQAAGRPKKHTVEKLLEVLHGQSLSTANWRKLAESEKGIPKSTFFELLDEAKETVPNLKQTQAGLWVYEHAANKEK
jgi:hypothetical protein